MECPNLCGEMKRIALSNGKIYYHCLKCDYWEETKDLPPPEYDDMLLYTLECEQEGNNI